MKINKQKNILKKMIKNNLFKISGHYVRKCFNKGFKRSISLSRKTKIQIFKNGIQIILNK